MSAASFHRRPARGYTVIEVLLAMTVLTIGAAGVMSMQKANIQGNLEARRTDIATNIARMWMERIQKDAMGWTLPSASTPGASNYGNAPLLGFAPSNGGLGSWVLPTVDLPAASGQASISPGFDILGRDIPTVAGLANAVFCVHLRETWLAQSTTNPADSLLRVELRVLWPRGISTESAAAPCAAGVVANKNPQDPDPNIFSTLYMVTAVRANAIQ
jgi:type IV pilus assembly protein PilV